MTACVNSLKALPGVPCPQLSSRVSVGEILCLLTCVAEIDSKKKLRAFRDSMVNTIECFDALRKQKNSTSATQEFGPMTKWSYCDVFLCLPVLQNRTIERKKERNNFQL